MLLPREHGAYGQLLFPLLSGALTLAVVMGLAVAAFTGTLAPVAPYAALPTAVNDNALLTYLATLVPDFSDPMTLAAAAVPTVIAVMIFR